MYTFDCDLSRCRLIELQPFLWIVETDAWIRFMTPTQIQNDAHCTLHIATYIKRGLRCLIVLFDTERIVLTFLGQWNMMCIVLRKIYHMSETVFKFFEIFYMWRNAMISLISWSYWYYILEDKQDFVCRIFELLIYFFWIHLNVILWIFCELVEFSSMIMFLSSYFGHNDAVHGSSYCSCFTFIYGAFPIGW